MSHDSFSFLALLFGLPTQHFTVAARNSVMEITGFYPAVRPWAPHPIQDDMISVS
jgi:hypothetical protein